jgi:preprotein translocase subunit SecY
MSLGLGQRIAFTLGALLVYRIGTYIPLPGIDPTVWEQSIRGGSAAASIVWGSSAIRPISILALSISPYISAAVVIQLFSLFALRAGAQNSRRRGSERYVLGLTVAFVALQALGIAFGLEGASGIAAESGWVFRMTTVISMIGGTFFLVWLSGLITVCGVGSGLALLLFVGMAVDLPAGVAGFIELGRQGTVSTSQILFVAVLAVAVLALVVFMELARRHVPIQYPRRQIGERMFEGQPSVLSLKINNAGVIPVALTTWFLSFQPLIGNFVDRNGPLWLKSGVAQLGHGQLGFMILATILIVFFTLLYTAVLLDADKAADRLVGYGGVVPGIMPGEATAEHLDHVLTRTTIIGAAYLALLYLLPEVLISYWAVPFYFSGISALILVCTVLDIGTQVRGDGLIAARGIRQ